MILKKKFEIKFIIFIFLLKLFKSNKLRSYSKNQKKLLHGPEMGLRQQILDRTIKRKFKK